MAKIKATDALNKISIGKTMIIGRQRSAQTPRLAVIGAGIVGVTIALEAAQAGLDVTIFERHSEPYGASVRNFGLIWISGRANGEELRLALAARRQWEHLASLAPEIGFRPRGSVTLFTRQDELNLARAALTNDPRNQRGLSILDSSQLNDMGLDIADNVIGGLYCEQDASVEPGKAVPALVRHLKKFANVTVELGAEVDRVNDGVITLASGTSFHFDAIVAATGASYGGFLTRHFRPEAIGLGTTRLLMAQSKPIEQRISPSIADADTMRYYPFFQFQDAPALADQPELLSRFGTQLLMVQRAGGEFTLGDTHNYDPGGEFQIDISISAYFIQKANALLPNVNLELATVWEGYYSRALDTKRAYVAKRLQDNFLLVTGTGGRGMTMAPAIAQETVEWLSNYFERTM